MFDDKTIKLLTEPLDRGLVSSREAFNGQNLSYMQSKDVIDQANLLFGFGMWCTEILSLVEVNRSQYVKPPFKSGDREKPMVNISYLATVRVTVKTVGDESVHEDTGFGDGTAGDTPSGLNSCIELASKEAVTDAVKRCMRYYGNQFGNSLYDKENQGIVDIADFRAQRDSTAPVTPEQLAKLRELADERTLDDKWMIAYLEGEGFREPLESLRSDWYQVIFKAVDEYGFAEREADAFVAKYDELTELMRESVNMNMLKGVFADAYKRAKAQNDKERINEATNLYNKIKAKFEDKK